MNSIREALAAGSSLEPLIKEAQENIRARARARGEEVAAVEPALPKHLFEGPKYDGKQCAVCERRFKASSEYLTCKLCKAVVCRRKGQCKHCHHGSHRVAFLKAKQQAEAAHG